MGNFFQSGLWCLGEPQYAEKKKRKFILYDVSKKRGESNKEHIGVLARINVNK